MVDSWDTIVEVVNLFIECIGGLGYILECPLSLKMHNLKDRYPDPGISATAISNSLPAKILNETSNM